MSRACVGSAATRLFASLRCGDCAAVLPIRCAARALQSSAATMSTNKVASTLLFALFALPSRVAAQDEYIRWIADPSDQTRSCASVCADAAVNGGGGACTAQSLARQHAVNSEPTLRAAMLAVASARLPGASTAWPCTSWNPQAQAGPSRWNGQCFYSTGASDGWFCPCHGSHYDTSRGSVVAAEGGGMLGCAPCSGRNRGRIAARPATCRSGWAAILVRGQRRSRALRERGVRVPQARRRCRCHAMLDGSRCLLQECADPRDGKSGKKALTVRCRVKRALTCFYTGDSIGFISAWRFSAAPDTCGPSCTARSL